ncbi:HEAT repeat domain-containing protein [Methanogenium marinum]|uniref:HEAT repeat domain-containing protein n=1 Tax=Methanogenium marinum TaxID=348610 RepID=A0A9Q4KTG6_9EURY|nr:HEAT repeat domain-containing protein [Methanogenium marinum]MDE4907687.1 HEAT repeat domain-containing protein [Methanogenium marinum]
MSEEVQKETGNRVSQLTDVLLGNDTYRSLQAMDSLSEIGMPAVAPLMELLTTGNNNVRWRSAMALARVGTHSVEPLIEVATTRDESIRNPAIWALAEIGTPKAVEPLVSIMQKEESECCRILTAAALLKINDPAGIDAVNREYERFGEEFRGRVTEAFVGS